jgi:uncharacterized SAM-binding protein YcdF (DUF218 family)
MYYQFLKYFTDAYVVCSCLLGTALAVMWIRKQNRRRPGFRWVSAAYLFSVVVAVPATSYWPLRWIEGRFPPLSDNVDGAQAIVVLGGGVFPPDSIRRRPELSPGSSRRCLYAWELYRRFGPLPVFVSGASVNPGRQGPGEAEAMKQFLLELGIRPEDLYLESSSSTTHENAIFTSRVLQQGGIEKIILVTEALHMARSEGCFRKQGIDVIPAPCSYRTTEFQWAYDQFFPCSEGLVAMNEAMHEWIGYGWYRLTGKL